MKVPDPFEHNCIPISMQRVFDINALFVLNITQQRILIITSMAFARCLELDTLLDETKCIFLNQY